MFEEYLLIIQQKRGEICNKKGDFPTEGKLPQTKEHNIAEGPNATIFLSMNMDLNDIEQNKKVFKG